MSIHKPYSINLVDTKEVIVDLMIDNLNYNDVSKAKYLGQLTRDIQGCLNKREKPSTQLINAVLHQVVITDDFGDSYNAIEMCDFDEEQTLAFLLTL